MPEESPDLTSNSLRHGTASLLGLVPLDLMKKTLHIDEGLLRQARDACGARTAADAVRMGLERLVRHAAYARLRLLRGTEPSAHDVPRRGRHRKLLKPRATSP